MGYFLTMVVGGLCARTPTWRGTTPLAHTRRVSHSLSGCDGPTRLALLGTQGVLFFQWLTGDRRFNALDKSLGQDWPVRLAALDELVGEQIVREPFPSHPGSCPLKTGPDNLAGC
jgi:hypothetical protein